MAEGSALFDLHRFNMLTSSERWIVYAVAQYKRALEMLVPVSAPWAQVTLYYASFYSANALLAMFGGWIGHVAYKTCVVEVGNGNPNQQILHITRGKSVLPPSGATGSHRIFWDFFYDAVPPLGVWVSTQMAQALSPVNGDYAWQIAERNIVNYDMHDAWIASRELDNNFDTAHLNSLTGPLAQQVETTEQLIRITLHFARELGFDIGGLTNCGVVGARPAIHRRLISQRPPHLINQSALAEFVL